MLTGIRKNQRALCHGLIILLLGSWVSYVCQPCFAHTNNPEKLQATVMKLPCHPVQHQQDRHDHPADNQPPGHDCNCHLYVAVAASEPDALSMTPASHGFDISPPLAYTLELRPWQMILTSTPVYKEPERATSPPFARYTVLLN